MHFFSCLFFFFFPSWFLWKSNFLTKHFSGLFPPHYLLTWESRVADFIKFREKVKGHLNPSYWNKEEENIERQVQSYSRTGLSVIKLIFLISLTTPQFSITDWVGKMVSDSWKSLAFSTYGGGGTKKQIKTKWKKQNKNKKPVVFRRGPYLHREFNGEWSMIQLVLQIPPPFRYSERLILGLIDSEICGSPPPQIRVRAFNLTTGCIELGSS